jgi:hypothetical protein
VAQDLPAGVHPGEIIETVRPTTADDPQAPASPSRPATDRRLLIGSLAIRRDC